jgi:hypothetical protein
LRGPSVIAPYSHDCLLAPAHHAFRKVQVHEAEALPMDERLVR